jgi:hypothetical protein
MAEWLYTIKKHTMKELLEKEKAEIEQRIKDNEIKIEELRKAIHWDKRRLSTNKRQMDEIMVVETPKNNDTPS